METTPATCPTFAPQPGSHPERFALDRCQQVSVCELSGAERFVVWAIRWRASCGGEEQFADSCLDDAFDRAGLRTVQAAFEGFMAASCPHATECGAAQRLGCWRLRPLEAHALHAIACLQSGLLGEAWKTLALVCARRQVGRALVHLEELAAALARVGGRVDRWQVSTRRVPAAGY
jgi:hypothetical protein